MSQDLRHDDCRNFIPIDVAKGICSCSQEIVLIDSLVCDKFAELAKCKVCSNFIKPDDKMLGICAGFKDGYWTYGDLKAVTCEKYLANK
jgi:4-hydroxyphenylacetate decarboxylase small subunit